MVGHCRAWRGEAIVGPLQAAPLWAAPASLPTPSCPSAILVCTPWPTPTSTRDENNRERKDCAKKKRKRTKKRRERFYFCSCPCCVLRLSVSHRSGRVRGIGPSGFFFKGLGWDRKCCRCVLMITIYCDRYKRLVSKYHFTIFLSFISLRINFSLRLLSCLLFLLRNIDFFFILEPITRLVTVAIGVFELLIQWNRLHRCNYVFQLFRVDFSYSFFE